MSPARAIVRTNGIPIRSDCSAGLIIQAVRRADVRGTCMPDDSQSKDPTAYPTDTCGKEIPRANLRDALYAF